jgi:2-phospho-L-lactate transferase/gluconeogenesis factor (CofD/UPF0052 family)
MPVRRSLSVVVFSGGRGSSVLSRELLTHPDIHLTLAINGYDDGLSTGEVRRFLGDALGPSDFRKNAAHLARALRACPAEVIDLLDSRLPEQAGPEQAFAMVRQVDAIGIADRLRRFEEERRASARTFDFSDCSVGNLVFAGSFLHCGRRFNDAVDDYCALLGLPAGLIENVTDGTNAFLVAVDLDDRLLASEADIVDAKRRNHIKNIYLLNRRVSNEEREPVAARGPGELQRWLEAHERRVPINRRLADRLKEADLIVYSPGTQHSSLFPSYLTEGLSDAIAGNVLAVKLLITNIQSDAELAGATAVDIIEKAAYYLREKERLTTPTPFLITHYLINDPRTAVDEAPYVPLGRLETLEDPRLVRISNYEDGVTGRHDPAKVLTPFLRSFLDDPRRQRIAVWLYDSGSVNKVSQTLLEMVRARLQDLAIDLTVFYGGVEAIGQTFLDMLPFEVRHTGGSADAEGTFRRALAEEAYDYAILFESSGMYNAEDLVGIAAPLAFGRLDAVWGSRRLSARDIEASLRLRYRHNAWLRAASVVGSQLLSGAYLLLYGRHISDTLSGVRGVRASYVTDPAMHLQDKLFNQRLLSTLLGQRAEILETPVRFYAMSPDQVRRTTIAEGLRSLGQIVWWRFARLNVRQPAPGAQPVRTAGTNPTAPAARS